MSLPFSKFVPISAKVQSAAFVQEKKHMLLATTNALLGTGTPFKEYSGAAALTNFANDLGKDTNDYKVAQKYFGFNSKTGNAPEKLVVARWYKTAAAPFVKGTKPATVAELKALTNAAFDITIGSTTTTLSLDFSTITNYADAAQRIQAAINNYTSGGTAFTAATAEYSTVTGGFVITGGDSGSGNEIAISEATGGTDAREELGLLNPEVSAGANAETFAEFCDRIFNANTAGFSITTTETLTDSEIEESVAWLQGSVGGQTISTAARLVFDIADKATAKALQSTLKELSYTGYVVCYDPYGEWVNALDCAIAASTDYQVANGSLNFNFQPAVGYTPITTLGDVINYQQGQTNLSLAQELDDLCISYVYSVGFGTQQQVLYGMGLMMGAYGTEDIQVNESAMQMSMQVAIMNGFVSLPKLKLQGSDSKGFIATLITPTLELFKTNGSIAMDGKLSNTDRNAIYQVTGNDAAADAVEQNGYYFQVQDLTEEDIRLRRVRVLVCYLAGGVVNQIRITDTIFGA